MPGWNTPRGTITNPDIDQEQIWGYFNVLFSNRSKNQTSYKFGFVRALLENLYNVDVQLGLDFHHIFWSFACLYWNLVVRQGLSQTDRSHEQSAIERVLREFQEHQGIPSELGFDSLSVDLQLKIVSAVKTQGKRYVIGAVWGDTEGTFYEFDLEKEYLRINPPVYRLMQRYQEVLYRLNSYEFVKFLQKVNQPDAYGDLIERVENVTRRSSLAEYRSMLEFNSARQCFYCGTDLACGRTTEVDHFIPWSFVHNDNLWNFVLSCRACNNSKRDRLASPAFLEHLVTRNENLKRVTQSPVLVEMTNYSNAKLTDLYQYAQNNGYSANWSPNRRLAQSGTSDAC